MQYNCRFCGLVEVKESLQKIKDDRIQISGKCSKCNNWLLFVPRKNSVLVDKILTEAYNSDVIKEGK